MTFLSFFLTFVFIREKWNYSRGPWDISDKSQKSRSWLDRIGGVQRSPTHRDSFDRNKRCLAKTNAATDECVIFVRGWHHQFEWWPHTLYSETTFPCQVRLLYYPIHMWGVSFCIKRESQILEPALQTMFTLKLISFYNGPHLKGSALWVTFWDVFQGSVSTYPKYRRLPRKYGTLRRSEQRRILRLPLWRQRQ